MREGYFTSDQQGRPPGTVIVAACSEGSVLMDVWGRRLFLMEESLSG